MKLVAIVSMLLSILFMQSSHPVMLMFVILAQTMTMALLVWVMSSMNWFSYILFLIFLGGLMVLFVYISSLASNEMFNLSVKSLFKAIFMGVAISTAVAVLTPNQTMTSMVSPGSKSFSMVYSNSMMAPTLSTMIYLLLTLIVVVKMTSKYEGPLRSMIF